MGTESMKQKTVEKPLQIIAKSPIDGALKVALQCLDVFGIQTYKACKSPNKKYKSSLHQK